MYHFVKLSWEASGNRGSPRRGWLAPPRGEDVIFFYFYYYCYCYDDDDDDYHYYYYHYYRYLE